jgi:hypothetical protein
LQIWAILIMSSVFVMFTGCDSGKEAIDDVTGNKTVKQFQKSKKDIEKVNEKETERLKSIPDDNSDKAIPEEGDEE